MDSVIRSVFLVQIYRLFELLTRFIHKMTKLVAMLAVPGCVYMLESVSFLNVEVFSESIHIFSVGNVELSFKKWFMLSMPWPVGKQECGSLRHITLNPSWLRTSKYIVLT